MNPVAQPLVNVAEYKYSDEYLLVMQEINKLSSNSPDTIEWPIVYSNCSAILEKINDFVIAGYLVFSCLKLRKVAEFESLLVYLIHLVDHYYTNPEAMPKKERFKHSALEWLYERIKQEGIDFPSKQLTEETINAILSNVSKLDQSLSSQNIDFGFLPACDELKKKSKLLAQEHVHKAELDKDNSFNLNGDIAPATNEIVEETFSENDLILKMLQDNSELITSTGRVTSEIIHINRSLIWHRINDLKDEFYESVTSVKAVPIDQVYQAKYLIDQNDYMKAAVQLECLFCQYPLSLDVQYYLFICAKYLDEKLLIEALTHSLKLLICRYPKLMFLQLDESIPCAGKKTIEWMQEKILQEESGASNLEFNDFDQLIAYYQQRLQKKLTTIDRLDLCIERSFQLARMNYIDTALSALEKIYKDLRNNPILIDFSCEDTHYVKCISLLYQCYCQKMVADNLQEYQHEIYQVILEDLSVYYPNMILVKETNYE